MIVLQEGDLEIQFPERTQARRFDNPDTHKLTYCMKAVDCIFEWNGKTYFLEIKDPDDPQARPEARAQFLKDLMGDKLISHLKLKFRDSFLFEYGKGRNVNGITYLVLLCMRTIDSPALLTRGEALGKALPLSHPDGPWKRPFASNCLVLSFEQWNKHFHQFPLRRLSQGIS